MRAEEDEKKRTNPIQQLIFDRSANKMAWILVINGTKYLASGVVL